MKAVLRLQDRLVVKLAEETANPAENLPDSAAIKITHLADLLISICLAKTSMIVTVL